MMRHLARWRWVLPFTQLCLISIFGQWKVEERLRQLHPPKPPSPPVSDGLTGAEVGWDPVSCWHCDSIAPLPSAIFLTVVAVFFRVGVQLDDRRATTAPERVWLIALAAASYSA